MPEKNLFNVMDIISRYEGDRYKAVTTAQQELRKRDFSVREMTVIVQVIDAYFNIKEQEDQKGNTSRRKRGSRILLDEFEE